MRRVRMVLGLAVAVCAFGALAAPAFAKKEKEPVIFGKFTASIPGRTISEAEPATTHGIGEVTEINLAKNGLVIKKCERSLKSKGEVVSASSDTFFQSVKFSKCKAQKPFGTGTEEVKLKSFAIDFEFHSNKAAVIGEGEGEIKIKKDSTLSIPVGKGACTVVIPEQTIPEKAERKPELEYEAASYTTEFEPAKIKKFPSGFQEKLNIEMEFKKVESWVKPAPGCAPGGVVNEVPETPGFGYVVYGNGTMELELEEITIKNGNVGFEPKKEEI